MKFMSFSAGVRNALLAALLFGASTPAAKIFLRSLSPLEAAGALYLGSGLGLAIWRSARRFRRDAVKREPLVGHSELGWLIGAIVSGGIVASVLLMIGLAATPASSASLLLNLEVCWARCSPGSFFTRILTVVFSLE